MDLIEILDPTGELGAVERPLAPRGRPPRRVGLLDIAKPRGDVFLDEVEGLLRRRNLEVVRFVKPTFARPAPPDLRREIARDCDAVIVALAD